ncbi:MAG: isoprenylcysteine carboxylmethyltransferase family protein [bacterium]|nr:isoprenylcysteine carboxylmethyltransferase family protein [bacterium]
MSFFKKAFKKIRTKLGFLAAVILVLFSAESVPVRLLIPGLVLIVIGELIRLWSAGHLKKTKEITCSGPYKYTRNPLYIGSFFILIGFLIMLQNWIIAVVIFPLFLIIYPLTIKKEERHLLEKFGDDFQRYMESVPRIIPILKAGEFSSEDKFNFQLMLKNREYQGVLGALGLTLILWFGLGYKLRMLLIKWIKNI